MTWRGEAEQRIVLDRRPVAVDQDRKLLPPRRFADRPHEVRIAIIGQHRIGVGDDRVGIFRQGGGDPFIAIGHDSAVAARIHEDRRQRRRQAVDALAEGAIDVFAQRAP